MSAGTSAAAGVKVSVAMITYNHERFVAQAIDSVLMQQTSFPFDLVIGEDCSTDGTRAIVCDYGARYPDRIRLLLPDHNLGMMPNAVATFAACRGQLVALLEGDDYWTDPAKLQRQADFLDAHPGCAICFHDVSVVDEEGRERAASYCPRDLKPVSTLEDLLVSSFIPTCATMYRNHLFAEFPPWYYTLDIGDRTHLILNAQHGDAGYIDAVLAAYRVHAGGAWSARQLDRRLSGMFRMYDVLDNHLQGRYAPAIVRGKRECLADFAVRAVEGIGSLAEGEAQARRALRRWQAELGFPAGWQRRPLSRVRARYLFAAHAGRDRTAMRRSFVRLIARDPAWLRNPGVWSIAFEAFFGPKAAGRLRGVLRGVVERARRLRQSAGGIDPSGEL